MVYRFVIALSRSPPRDNSRPGVQAKDIIGGIVLRKKNLSIAVPAKFIQIVDSFTGLRRRREEGWGGGRLLSFRIVVDAITDTRLPNSITLNDRSAL